MIKPFWNKIIIEVDKPVEEKSKGGIYVPPSAGAELMVEKGTVVAVGPGIRNPQGKLVPTIVAVGDRIVFNPHALQKIKISVDEEYTYIVEHDIIGLIEE